MLEWEKLPEDFIEDYQVDYIEQLLQHACISIEEKCDIERLMFGYSVSEANEVITRLKDAQVDPIEAGNNYSQTDISKKLKQII